MISRRTILDHAEIASTFSLKRRPRWAEICNILLLGDLDVPWQNLQALTTSDGHLKKEGPHHTEQQQGRSMCSCLCSHEDSTTGSMNGSRMEANISVRRRHNHNALLLSPTAIWATLPAIVLSHVPGSIVQELRSVAAYATGSTICRHKAFKWLDLRSAPTLQEARAGKRITMDDLWRFAALCRVANVMRPYMGIWSLVWPIAAGNSPLVLT